MRAPLDVLGLKRPPAFIDVRKNSQFRAPSSPADGDHALVIPGITVTWPYKGQASRSLHDVHAPFSSSYADTHSSDDCQRCSSVALLSGLFTRHMLKAAFLVPGARRRGERLCGPGGGREG